MIAGVTASLPSMAGAEPPPPVTRTYLKGAKRLPAHGLLRLGGYDHVSLAAYRDLRNASIALLRLHPPDQSVYIGLGRDPAPIIAFLQGIGADALNFPASGASFSESPSLDEHFARLIPKRFRQGSRNLVLIDQTSSGKTIHAIKPLLRDYLHRTGSAPSIKAVAFNEASGVTYGRSGITTISTKPFPEVHKFFYPPYEGVVSPFRRHSPGTNTLRQLTYRPEYDRFRAAVKKRITRDEALDRFLAGLLGRSLPPRTRAQAWGLRRPYRSELPTLGRGATVTVGDPQDAHGALGAAEYAELRWAATTLLARRTPDGGRFYLGAGRGASALVAFLENLGAPVSYVSTEGVHPSESSGRLTAAWNERFSRSLAEAIPAAVLRDGLRITIVQQGEGIDASALRRLVERFVAAAGSRSAVEIVSFRRSKDEADDESVTISTRAMPALQRLGGTTFSPIASYAYHPQEKLPPSDYPRMKKALQERMRRDRTLDRFLAQPEL